MSAPRWRNTGAGPVDCGGHGWIHTWPEATGTAVRTGEGSAYKLWFGPTNVAAWRLSVAVERGDGGILELSRALDPAASPSKERQAGHWINVG
jgi:hypothetical protein